MKKVFSIILATFAVACTAISVSACNIWSGGVWEQHNDVSIGFVSDADCPNGAIDDKYVVSDFEPEPDQTFYLIVDYLVKPEYRTDGDYITALVRIGDTSTAVATLQEAQSGDFRQYEADGFTNIEITHRIPEIKSNKLRAVVRLKAISQYGSIKISMLFGNNGNRIELLPEVQKSLHFGYTQGLEFIHYSGTDEAFVNAIGRATDLK